jgi:hypothetical protein
VENMPLLGTEPRLLGPPARRLVDILTGPSRRRNKGKGRGGKCGDKDNNDDNNKNNNT